MAKTKRLRKWTPIIIEWEDAVTVYDPSHSDEDHETAIRRTTGFLIKKNRKSVTVSMEDDRDSATTEADIQTVTTIPAKMVKKIIPLKEDKEELP